nr:hypothetical protein [Tanacetum cinerariifolium]
GEFNTDFHPMVDFIAASPLRIVPLFDTMLIHPSEGSGTPTEPHHTPSLKADTSHPTTSSIPLSSLSTAPIPPVTQTDTNPIRQYSKRARIAQSSALLTIVDEPASPMRDVSEGEACPTESGFIADQDRATIAKSPTLPHDSAPRAQEVDILRLKERVQVLEDRESVVAKHSRDDAPIKGRSINEGKAAAERISNDSEDIARVLTSMDAATVLAGGIDVPTGSGSIPTTGPPATVISTGSEVGPTASPIVTSYSRRKGKEVMVESDTPKKQRLQEQIDAQVARELEEQQEKDDMRMNEQIARDAEVERIHAEEELQESTEKANDQEAEERLLYGYDQKQLRVEDLLKQLDREDLNQLWALVKEYFSIRPATSEKEMELWVELKRLYEPDPEDQLWTLTQNFMHAPVEWKLYDLSGVHHVTAKDKEIFMLVEKDYHLRKGEEVSNTVALEERTIKLDEGQAGLDPGKTLESRPLPERKFMEDQAGSDPGQSYVPQAKPNLEPMHEDFIAIIYPKVHERLKLTTKEQVHIENPPSSSETLSSMKNLRMLLPLVINSFMKNQRKKNQEKLMWKLKLNPWSLFPSIEPLYQSHLDHTTMFFSYLGLTLRKTKDGIAHINILRKALMNYAIPDTYASRTGRCDDQDPPPPPPKDCDPSKKKKEAPSSSSKPKPASPSKNPVNDDPILVDMHLSEAHDTGVAHLLKIKTRPDWLKPLPEEEIPETPKPDWVIPPNDLPETENNWADALAKTYKDLKENTVLQKTRDIASFIKCKPLPLGGPPGQVTIKAQYFFSKDLEYLVFGNKERRHALSISKLKMAYYPDFGLEELIPSLWTESESAYDVSSAYNISHWWFKRKEFYITRHNAPSDRNAVRSHIKILSVVSLMTFYRYDYTFLKEIVLRRADYKEYKILKADFKNLHPSDF